MIYYWWPMMNTDDPRITIHHLFWNIKALSDCCRGGGGPGVNFIFSLFFNNLQFWLNFLAFLSSDVWWDGIRKSKKSNNISVYNFIFVGICKDKTLDAISVTVKILFVTHGGRLKGWLWKIVSSYRGSVRSKHQNNLPGIYKNVLSYKYI